MAYRICDGHGNELADGFESQRSAELAAGAAADERGESVYVYAPGDTDESATSVEPSAVTPGIDVRAGR